MRIGVLYPDGSMSVLRPGASDEEALEEVRSANVYLLRSGPGAKLVSIDLEDGDVVELKPEDPKL